MHGSTPPLVANTHLMVTKSKSAAHKEALISTIEDTTEPTSVGQALS